MMKEIQETDYSVRYDDTSTTVKFQGSLRLGGMTEYQPIVQLLNEITESEPAHITLNLTKLKFLNSSGISMLSKFVINIRKKKTIGILVQGSHEIPWQGKSLKNLQRLMPGLELEFE